MDELMFKNRGRLFIKDAFGDRLDTLPGFEDEVLEALDQLDEHLVMDEVHEREIGEYLNDNPEIAERPGLLLAAGAVPLHEMSKVQYDDFLVYSMGDTVVVEESAEEGWQSAATVPYEVAVLVAQARAQNRAGALRWEHEELRADVDEEIRRQLEELYGEDDEPDPFFGASPVQTAQSHHAAPATQTVGVAQDVNINISGAVDAAAEGVMERVKDGRLKKRYSISGSFEDSE